MKFKDIQKLSDVKFRRLTGVSWATFNLMLAEINKQLPRHIGKGRPQKLPLEDRLLMYRILERISNIFPSWYELRCI
uniref:hypothetical protein n=1 Tax=Acinetobacter nosocomialis TaxID=106654 RepID=UPI001F4C18FD|nr:hypothetical protein [Acinetobacter nosocomialis]ULG20600.1 hypothetical protein ANMEGGLA_00174 [Acinetobacter nosocomialis]